MHLTDVTAAGELHAGRRLAIVAVFRRVALGFSLAFCGVKSLVVQALLRCRKGRRSRAARRGQGGVVGREPVGSRGGVVRGVGEAD